MAYQQAGQAWVAADSTGVPGSFLVIDLVDGCAHIEQISVHPRHARQGWGRKLIGHVAAWSTDRGIPALTLTTFRDVPFNAPYFRQLGFTELEPAQFTPGLVKILDAGAAFGLDLATRVCMRRPAPARNRGTRIEGARVALTSHVPRLWRPLPGDLMMAPDRATADE